MEGAAGLPVFAGGSGGAAVLIGPTGGYLVGFLAAAIAVGWLAERGWDRHVLSTIMAMVIGNLVIYLLGVPWLKTVLGVSWADAFTFGLTPFLIGDLIKIGLAAIVLPLGWRFVGKRASK